MADDQQKAIYIYNGPGVSKIAFNQTLRAVEKVLPPSYRIQMILPTQVATESWEQEAALFIIPGGADIPYAAALNGIGNRKIRSFVEHGGSFLGICAGSYYAGSFVDFAKDTSLEVQGERELAFFPGVVRGPVLSPYDYRTASGARAAKLIWACEAGFKEGETFTVFYNGGGYFVDALGQADIAVLASYDVADKFPAIIQCHIGLGKAILSGVHFEYDPSLLDPKNPYLSTIIPDLERGNDSRIRLLEHLLERLLEK